MDPSCPPADSPLIFLLNPSSSSWDPPSFNCLLGDLDLLLRSPASFTAILSIVVRVATIEIPLLLYLEVEEGFLSEAAPFQELVLCFGLPHRFTISLASTFLIPFKVLLRIVFISLFIFKLRAV